MAKTTMKITAFTRKLAGSQMISKTPSKYRRLDRFFRKRVNSQLDIRSISRLINANLSVQSDLCGLPRPSANNNSGHLLFTFLRLYARDKCKVLRVTSSVLYISVYLRSGRTINL